MLVDNFSIFYISCQFCLLFVTIFKHSKKTIPYKVQELITNKKVLYQYSFFITLTNTCTLLQNDLSIAGNAQYIPN